MGASNDRGWDISFDDGYDADLMSQQMWTMFRVSGDGVGSAAYGWELAALGEWRHAAGVFEPGVASRFYWNGELVFDCTVGSTGCSGTVPATLHDPTVGLNIARKPTNAGHFDGLVDEVRVSSVARSSEWISTSFANQSSPTTFVEVGPPLPAW